MMKFVGKPQLMAASASISKCADPGCTKPHHSVTMVSACCTVPLMSTYEPQINALVMTCPKCSHPRLVIAVAEIPPPMEWEPMEAKSSMGRVVVNNSGTPVMAVKGPGSVN